MALQFKRTRLDAAQQRTFPNSKEEVIFRNDVSNKNLLQNPFRTSGIPVGPVGVQNRPVNPMVDDRGAMYGGSVSVLRKGVSNSNLLHNPYRFKTDPIDDPRTLTRQVINDINSGKAPQYIRENKGIDEIAFMIVKALPDNGVKLATLSMLKSYITGMRLQSVLDQGGQNVTKAFDVLNQLVVTSKSLYRTGMLGIKLPALLLQYSENIAKIFGDVVLQPVSPVLMFSAIQDLASVSSILTKLFRAQNSVSTPTNVSIDEWAKAEAAKIQALRQQQEQQTPPPPTPQVDATGDNHPTGTEGVRDPNNIKQEGKGKMSKKKKIPKTGGGLSVNWGIANPSNTQLTPNEQPTSPINEPSLIQNGPIPVNTMPPDPNASKGEKTFDKISHYAGNIVTILGAAGTIIGGVVGAVSMYDKYKQIGLLEAENDDLKDELVEEKEYRNRQEDRENRREQREIDLLKIEKIEKIVRPWEVLNKLGVNNKELYTIFDDAYSQVLNGISPLIIGNTGFPHLDENVDYINSAKNNIELLLRLKNILFEQVEVAFQPPKSNKPRKGFKPPIIPKSAYDEEDLRDARALAAAEGLTLRSEHGSSDDEPVYTLSDPPSSRTSGSSSVDSNQSFIDWAERQGSRQGSQGSQVSAGRKRKSKKSLKSKTKKSTIKKSKNLDAQILALLRA